MENFKNEIKAFFTKHKFGLIIAVIGIIIAIVDLLTKALAEGVIQNLINGVVSIYSTHNTGAAWSILNEHTWLLVLISSVFIVLIIIANYMFKEKNKTYSVAVGLILGGAICNLIDRLVFGYVRDFISLDFINFPIFNVADISITVGVIILCCFFLFSKRQNEEGITVQKQEVCSSISTTDASEDKNVEMLNGTQHNGSVIHEKTDKHKKSKNSKRDE